MSVDDNEIHKKMTFNEKLALFNRKNLQPNSKGKEKKLNAFEKKLQLYQPKKPQENSFQINDIKKRENRYLLKERNNENNINKKINKSNLSNSEYTNLGKHDNNSSNQKNNNNIKSARKISDIKVYPNTNTIGNVSEKIKKFNQNEEKKKINYYSNSNNPKGTIKSIAKVNEFNPNDKNNNEQFSFPTLKKIKIFNNKNNIQKESLTESNRTPPSQALKVSNRSPPPAQALKVSNRTPAQNLTTSNRSPPPISKNNKILENVMLFSKKPNQNKINNEIKIKNKRNIKDKIAFFNNDIKNSQLNKSQEITEGNNNQNLNISKESKNKENNNRKFSDSNNQNKTNHRKQNIKENVEKIIKVQKPINITNKENKNSLGPCTFPTNDIVHRTNYNKRYSNKKNPIINLNNKENNKRLPLNQNTPLEQKTNTPLDHKQNWPLDQKKNIPFVQKPNIPFAQKEVPEIRNRGSNSLPKKNTNKLDDNDKDKKEYIFLDSIKIKPETKINSFCRAFFIASFPKKNIQIIKNSEETSADCGHYECSLMPAFEPEIIYKYPEKDSKDLELNNISASICFPNSIKVCYCENEDQIYSLKNHRCCFTNQTGDRFYAMMFHFYERMNNKDFYINYESSLAENITMKYSDEIGENLEKKILLINNINEKKYVYIPYCLCLISEYPYFPQLEKCLQSIMLSIKDSSSLNKINEIISYLIKSIPSPYLNTSIYFPIPYYKQLIELNPTIYQDLYLYGNNSIFLLNKLSTPNIILLFKLLLFEQKILLISSEYDNLTQISLTLISLLYPLSWIHIYLPIITKNMLKYLQSFLPFFSGMNKSLFETEEVQNLLVNSHKDLFIFDIDKNCFEISCNLKGKKKVNPIKFLNSAIPSFPKQIEDIILEQLNIVKSYCQKTPTNNITLISVNIKMKLLFIQTFIELFHDYKKYLAIIDNLPVFNTNAFLKDRPEIDKKFYEEITTTQLYQVFIQNSLSYPSNDDKTYFFDEIMEKYLYEKEQNLKSKYYMVLHDKFRSSMKEKLFTSKKKYIIQPSSHLKLFSQLKPFENLGNQNLNKSKKRKSLIDEINLYLKEELKDNTNSLNTNEILEENNRIIYNEINISNKNDIKELFYFITPEEKSENEKNKVKHSNEDFQSIKSKNLENKTSNNNKNNKNDDLNDIEKEDIRDNIKGTLTRVFKSEKVNLKKDTEVLLESLKKDYGKNYFVDIIAGNRNSKEVKIINDESFTILFEVISKFLLKLTKNKTNYIYAIKLIKSSSYFKTIVNKITYFLNEKICEKLTIDFPFFSIIEFWDRWLEEELNEDDLEILNKLREVSADNQNYYFIDEDSEEFINFKNNYKNQMRETLKTMGIMKLPKSIKLTMVECLCNKYLIDIDFKKELVLEIMH